jgi:hypothetical protein
MEKKIAVILGDGIGPEVTQQSIKVLDTIAKHFSHQFTYTNALMGACAIDETGNPLPDETIKICLGSDAILNHRELLYCVFFKNVFDFLIDYYCHYTCSNEILTSQNSWAVSAEEPFTFLLSKSKLHEPKITSMISSLVGE